MSAPTASAYRLRPAEHDDADELFRIHCEAMAAYLRQAFEDWSEALDRQQHDRWMLDGRAQVIVVHGRVVGSLDVVRDGDALWLLRLELDPTVHGRGLGTAIVRDLQLQASDQGLRVVLDVFAHNPARRLYERLGFHDVGREGPSIKMQWRSAAAEPDTSEA